MNLIVVFSSGVYLAGSSSPPKIVSLPPPPLSLSAGGPVFA